MGFIQDADVKGLIDNKELMAEVAKTLVEDPETMDNLADDIADKLGDELGDSWGGYAVGWQRDGTRLVRPCDVTLGPGTRHAVHVVPFSS